MVKDLAKSAVIGSLTGAALGPLGEAISGGAQKLVGPVGLGGDAATLGGKIAQGVSTAGEAAKAFAPVIGNVTGAGSTLDTPITDSILGAIRTGSDILVDQRFPNGSTVRGRDDDFGELPQQGRPVRDPETGELVGVGGNPTATDWLGKVRTVIPGLPIPTPGMKLEDLWNDLESASTMVKDVLSGKRPISDIPSAVAERVKQDIRGLYDKYGNPIVSGVGGLVDWIGGERDPTPPISLEPDDDLFEGTMPDSPLSPPDVPLGGMNPPELGTPEEPGLVTGPRNEWADWYTEFKDTPEFDRIEAEKAQRQQERVSGGGGGGGGGGGTAVASDPDRFRLATMPQVTNIAAPGQLESLLGSKGLWDLVSTLDPMAGAYIQRY